MNCHEELYKFIDELSIIDTHEHLPLREELRNKDADVFQEYLSHYISTDLISAGLSQEQYRQVMDGDLPIMTRWKILEPYWDCVQFTGYARALQIAVRDLYGIPHIGRDTIEELNEKFRASIYPGRFREVLHDKCKIEKSLTVAWDRFAETDTELFKEVQNIEFLMQSPNSESLRVLEQYYQGPLRSLADWQKAGQQFLLCRTEHQRVPVFKIGFAYQRPLLFEQVEKEQAEEVFLLAMKNLGVLNTAQERLFQDYMMHEILKFLSPRHAVIQFHTGLQEGNGNILENSDPSLLNQLFLLYPNIRFDIFHMGIPYQGKLEMLVKMFPNVYINLCWVHIISPIAAVEALDHWLDTLPINKILAFGGDYLFIDGVYGHQKMARQNVCNALYRKIEQGVLTLEDAKKIAQMIFFENPAHLYGI